MEDKYNQLKNQGESSTIRISKKNIKILFTLLSFKQITTQKDESYDSVLNDLLKLSPKPIYIQYQ